MRKYLLKWRHFTGPADATLPPLFLNTLPKAGTNFLENVFVSLGYKRNICRCLNEGNQYRARIVPRRGRFYVGHLFDDEVIHSKHFVTVFAYRDLWRCIESYANYMYIDKRHPVSAFLRTDLSERTIRQLIFTSQNPNGRPLLSEYIRFNSIQRKVYDINVDYDELIFDSTAFAESLAALVNRNASQVRQAIINAKRIDSPTKNLGRINIFAGLSKTALEHMKQEVREVSPI